MTPDELDALPTDSLIRVDGEVYERVHPDYVRGDETWRCLHEYDERRGFLRYSARVVLEQGRMTALALPGDPQSPGEREVLRSRLDAVIEICQRPRQGTHLGVHIDYDEVLAAATGRDEGDL